MTALAISPLFLAAALQATSPFPNEFFVPWDGDLVDEVHAGLLSDNLALDLVLRSGAEFFYVHDAGSVAALMPTDPAGVVDSALLRGDGAAGSESIAYTTGAGLFQLLKDPGSTVSFTTVDLQAPGWAGRVLYDAPWNGGAALASVGATEVSVATWSGTALAPVTNFQYSGAVYAVDTMDWDDDGNDDIAVLIDDRLDVYTDEGIPLFTLSSGVAGGDLVISRAGGDRDVAVWEVSLETYSVVMALNSAGLTMTSLLGTPGGLVSLDEDGDGWDDLVRLNETPSVGGPGDGELFRRIGDGTSFGDFEAFLATAGTFVTTYEQDCHLIAATANVRGTATGDFDNDGDLDFLRALSGTGGHDLRLMLNGTVDEEELRFSWSNQAAPSLPTYPNYTESMTLALYEPPDPTFVNQATHARLEMWVQEDVDDTTRTWIPGAPQPAFVAIAHGGGQQTPAVTATFVAGASQLEAIRMYVVTQVVLDGNDEIVTRGPSSIVFYTPDPDLREVLNLSLSRGCDNPGDPTNGSAPVNGGRGGYGSPTPGGG